MNTLPCPKLSAVVRLSDRRTWFGVALSLVLLTGPTLAVERFAAGIAAGDGRGHSAANPASYLDGDFWRSVDADARQEPTTVHLLAGHYNSGELTLTALGNAQHLITVVGDGTGAIFDTDGDYLLHLKGCRNLQLQNIHFTGNARKYGVTVTGITSERRDAIIPVPPQQLHTADIGDRPGQDIVFAGCTWIDLRNVFYGALCLSTNTHHITVRDCTFQRVGLERHAHMMYNGGGSHHLFIYRNTFEDCSGSYVRFRNRSDYGYVFNNTFRSTGTLPTEDASTSTFLQVPLYNSFDPGEETFGTNFYVIGNSFNWAADPVKRDVHDPIDQINFHSRDAIRFHQGGFETRGYRTLLSKEEGYTLNLGAPSAKLVVLRNAGLHLERMAWYGNSYSGPIMQKAAYGCLSEFGAFPKSRGFDTYADITNALTQREMFRDSFETDADQPRNWAVTQGKDTSVATSFADAMDGRRSVLLQDSSTEGACALTRAIDPTEGLYFSAWFYFYDNARDHVCLGDGKTSWVVAGRSGFWENDRGRCIANATYIPGKWYHVEMALEQGARDYSIWIDGVLISKDIKDPAQGPIRRFDGPIRLSPADDRSTGAMLVDDVTVASLGERPDGVRILSAKLTAPDVVRVDFSEPVDIAEGDGGAHSATNPLNYMVSNRFFPAYDYAPVSVTRLSPTAFAVKLQTAPRPTGTYLWLTTLRSEKGLPLSPTARFVEIQQN